MSSGEHDEDAVNVLIVFVNRLLLISITHAQPDRRLVRRRPILSQSVSSRLSDQGFGSP